jgi:hypothetical protein
MLVIPVPHYDVALEPNNPMEFRGAPTCHFSPDRSNSRESP